jgi:hypothetical protein
MWSTAPAPVSKFCHQDGFREDEVANMHKYIIARTSCVFGVCLVGLMQPAGADNCVRRSHFRAPQDEWASRLQPQVRRICRELAEAQDIVHAYDLLDELDRLLVRENEMEDVMRSLGRMHARFDSWLYSYSYADLGSAAKWRLALSRELSLRPNLLKAFRHTMRYEGMSDSTDNVANWQFQLLADTTKDEPPVWQKMYAAEEQLVQVNYVILLQLGWAICGHPEQAHGLNLKNWPDRYGQWANWWKKYGPYLRFDDKRGYMVLDSKAWRSRTPLPDKSRIIPYAKTPHPDWSGPLPRFWEPKDPKRQSEDTERSKG